MPFTGPWQVIREDSQKSPLVVQVYYKAMWGSKVAGEHMVAAAQLF